MRKNIFGFIVLAMMALLTWSCGGGDTATPTAVAEKAIECIQAGDYEGYVDLIAVKEADGKSIEEQKQQLTDLLKGKAASTIDKAGGIKSYEILSEEIAEDGNSAKVKAKLVYGDDSTKEQKFKILKTEDGEWKLDPKK